MITVKGVRAGINPAPTVSPLTLNCGGLSPILNVV